MKKKLFYSIIFIILIIISSAIIESLFFNSHVFFYQNNYENINYDEVCEEKKCKINLKLDAQYVNKLIVKYQTPSDIQYNLKYSYRDLFDKEKINTFSDIFDNSFEASIININQIISNVTIEYTQATTHNLKISSIELDNEFHFNFTRTFIIFLILLLFFLIFIFYKQGFSTEKIHIYFAIICSIFGIIIIIAQPSTTFYSYDDQIHFQHTVNLFSGYDTYSIGEYSSINVDNSTWRDTINSIEEQSIQNEFLNSDLASYPKNTTWLPTFDKIAYIPTSISYHLAKIIKLPFTLCFKIGKIINLLFYVLLMAYAIKTTKIGKRLLTVIALLPTNIFLASEYSYDPAVFAGISIFIVHLVNLFLDKTSKFDFKTAVIMLASISYACLTKAVYAPFLLLSLFIPKNRFQNIKQNRLVKIGLFIITILLLSTYILPAVSGSLSGDPRGGDTSVNGQLSLILSHPFDFLKLLGNTAVAQFSNKFMGGLNDFAYIPNLATISSANFTYATIFILFFVFITDNDKNNLTKKYRISMLLSSVFVILLIWTALYISFTPVGLNTINGVQNRYFLPLLFPILLCLQPKNIQTKINPRSYNALIIITPTIITLISIVSSIVAVFAY